MILADMHSHSDFSGDCKTPMGSMIESAIKKGLKYYAITEHHDLDFPECGVDFTLDIHNYMLAIKNQQIHTPNNFDLLIGMEFGFQSHLKGILRQYCEKYPFDFIIGSCHLASNGKDPYQQDYYEGLTRDEGYMKYFEAIYKGVTEFDDFDTLGHMDYVIRYWRGQGTKLYELSAFKDIIEAILETLIRKDKSLEVNTMGYFHKLGGPNPNYSVLTRYFEMGGELLTIGSDAHVPDNIGYEFELVESELKKIGFRSYTTYKNRKPIQLGF